MNNSLESRLKPFSVESTTSVEIEIGSEIEDCFGPRVCRIEFDAHNEKEIMRKSHNHTWAKRQNDALAKRQQTTNIGHLYKYMH